MKNLPLIESDYPLFSWEGSNGSATAEQTQKAYIAITSKGQTSDFSRFVWNDLVDKANYAVKASGEEWKTYYGLTAEETKIQSKYDALTSKKFNSVTRNIDEILGNVWKWSYREGIPGYLGYTRVTGASDVNKYAWAIEADNVYGWYIEEIVRVLNLFLTILKNEADFGELGTKQVSVDSAIDAELSVPESKRMESIIPVRTITGTALTPAQAKHLEPSASNICRIDSATVLTCATPIRFEKTDLAILGTYSTSKLLKRTPGRFETWYKIGVNVNAKLKDLLYAGKMYAKTSVYSNTDIDLTVAKHGMLVSRARLRSSAKVGMVSEATKRMETRASVSRTFVLDSLGKIPSKQLSKVKTEYHSKSSVSMQGVARETKRLTSDSLVGNITHYAKFVPLVPARMFFMESSRSTPEAKLIPSKPGYLGKLPSLTASMSAALVKLRKAIPKRMRVMASYSITSLTELIPAKPAYLLGNAKSAITSLTELIPAKPAYLLGNAKSAITSLTELIPAKPALANAKANSTSDSLASLHKAEPKWLYVASSSGVHASSVLGKIETKRFNSIATLSETLCSGKISRRVPGRIESKLNVCSKAIATLSFYGKQPDYWYDPVRSGNNLYIRNVWAQHGEGTNVHIGHKFYEAEKDGTTLHIRSIFGEEHTDGNMDLRFKYFEPIQDNGNIYIRSIENLTKKEE